MHETHVFQMRQNGTHKRPLLRAKFSTGQPRQITTSRTQHRGNDVQRGDESRRDGIPRTTLHHKKPNAIAFVILPHTKARLLVDTGAGINIIKEGKVPPNVIKKGEKTTFYMGNDKHESHGTTTLNLLYLRNSQHSTSYRAISL